MIEQFLEVLKGLLAVLKEISGKLNTPTTTAFPTVLPTTAAAPQAEKAVAQPAVSQQPESAQIAVPPTPTRDQCGNALLSLATTKGRDVAVVVLTKFNAQKLADVKESDYAAFFNAVTEAGK